MNMIFFDTETTGLKPGQICQLSYIKVSTDVKPQKVEGKNFFFSVEDIEPSAEAIHGFSVEDLIELSDGCEFSDLYEEFINDFVNCDLVIGYNVNFDIKFLVAEFFKLGINYIPQRDFCAMKYYKDICSIRGKNGDIKNPKLAEVVEFLNIDENLMYQKTKELFGGSGRFHDARFDTTATYLIITEGIKKKLIPPFYFTKYIQDKE